MEDWSFPPAYDEAYRPPPDSSYWFPVRETMHPSDREKAILTRLQEVCAYAFDNSPFYRRKWDAAGFHPSLLKSLEDFELRVPVITKAELRAAQAAVPPFGDYLCVPENEIFHIHGTSGTTGRPTAFAIGRDDWRAISNAHARIMWGMGVRPGDTVCVAAIFSLYVGSWGALAGAERLGSKAFPFGAGAAGMSARCAQWLDILKPSAFYGTPTYALHLAQTALDNGLDPRGFGLRTMFFSGEPGASIPAVRAKIEETYGAKAIDCGSMGEMTPWMNVSGSAETDGMLCWQDVVYTEVCDPARFRRVPYGRRGTPVYTHLERTSQPMIRLVSGDLTLWVNEPNPCGRTYPRLPMGIIGRIDDMFTVRGENVYPSEIDAVLNKTEGYGGEHRIVITRDGAMDELAVKVEAVPEIWRAGEARVAAFRHGVAASLQKLLGLRAVVEIVAQHSLERTDFKARRVIDDREALTEMRRRLSEVELLVTRRYISSSDLTPRVEKGEVFAVARLISRAEVGEPEAREAIGAIYRKAGRAHVVGITGVPGSGKSTLVGKLVEKLRAQGLSIAIVAIDPSSPYSGGSILGDRIRMSNLALDPGVFIRSMATRGAVGGMAHAALDVVDILDVAGFDIVIIETVGVGQDEVEVAHASHTTIVVSAPGLGDEVQAIKAGILEIADIHVVSKCDRSDSNRTLADLKMMLKDQQGRVDGWRPPVVGVSSFAGQGFDELIAAVERHRAASKGDAAEARRKSIAAFRLRKTAETLVIEKFETTLKARMAEAARGLVAREDDPYTAANRIVRAFTGE